MSSVYVEQNELKQAIALVALFEAAEHDCKTPRERVHKNCPHMTVEQARTLLRSCNGYVGEWCGRKLYLDFSEGPFVRTDNYNRVNGTSKAQTVIRRINNPVVLTTTGVQTQVAAR